MNSNKNIGTPEDGLSGSTGNRFLIFILGIFIGLAVIIPGVSGSAIAIIFGLYTAMLYALGNIFNDFKRCIGFLIPLLLGAVIGFGAGFVLVKLLFEKFMFDVVCLFGGFMIGSIPAISKEIRNEAPTPRRSVLFLVGTALPVAIGILSIVLSSNSGASDATFTSFPAVRYIAYVPLGIAVALTQIIPGLSATAILMAFGQFTPILNSVSVGYILDNPQVIGLYAALGGGFVIGIIALSRFVSFILTRYRVPAFFAVTGMACGSVISMFINPDMYDIYMLWGASAKVPTLEIVIGVLLLAAGFALSFVLTRIENKFSK